jgi:serine/threonine protein kinase
VILEKNIMIEVDHPFLIGIDYMFMNELRIYFVMPFVEGGELFDIIL